SARDEPRRRLRMAQPHRQARERDRRRAPRRGVVLDAEGGSAMSDEEWLGLGGQAAREAARRDRTERTRAAGRAVGQRLLAPLDDRARARMLAAFPPPRAKRSGRARLAFAASGGLALAAAVALWVRGVGREATLPSYEVSVRGPSSATRGTPSTGDV